jgi:hypothetical protein
MNKVHQKFTVLRVGSLTAKTRLLTRAANVTINFFNCKIVA